MSTDSRKSTAVNAQRGITLIELVMFIVIVSVGLTGILSVMNMTSRHSADPQLRKQAVSIAKSLLEEIQSARFTYCDPADANAETATSPSGCATVAEAAGLESGNTRPYDNVNDYVPSYGTSSGYSTDLTGTSYLTGFTPTVTVIATDTLSDGTATITSTGTSSTTTILRITVKVTYNNGNDSVSLDGYRMRYAPNLMP